MKSSEAGDRAETMSIGALAARFGLDTHVLRHWKKMGLLHPGRDAGGRRRYDADDLTRVAVILLYKEAGLALDTIRGLFATADRGTRRGILHREAEQLRARIAAAQASLDLIEGGLNCTHQDITRCPNYQRRVADRISARAAPAP
ncbi:MerR family transcriptional regulator [Streptomyces sp. NPDC020917]|uniref:MerR family transcriptional regulator n=1 Tax=Streptomyces sp. NPDC020917 TaxID=3365102 RepID=UPI00379054AD